jgi:predicted nucleic acid-binding protein
VDTCAVIYFVEKIEPYHSTSRPLWDALAAGTQEVVTSELTLLEVLVKPLRAGDMAMASLYRNLLLSTLMFSSLPVDRATLEAAAMLRAGLNLKTPDAIHAASAQKAGCGLFVTNDAGFRKVPGLKVAVLAEVAAS